MRTHFFYFTAYQNKTSGSFYNTLFPAIHHHKIRPTQKEVKLPIIFSQIYNEDTTTTMARLSIFYVAAMLSLFQLAQGFTTTSNTLNRRSAASTTLKRKSKWTMYMPSSSSNSQPQASAGLRAVGAPEDRGSSGWKSKSVLASCDTLPSFRTAHGLLSPETVYRMNQRTQGGHDNEAVATFLERYRREGPMSCLSMLSDPDVLPHLTEAMRDSA